MSSVPRDLSVTSVSASSIRADALFASALQRSDRPSPGQVRRAIAVAVARYGDPGRAGLRRATGDRGHPDALGAHDGGRRIRRRPAGPGPRRMRPAGTRLTTPGPVTAGPVTAGPVTAD